MREILKNYIFLLLILQSIVLIFATAPKGLEIIELVDSKWDQIQKGQWLIGFFDSKTEDGQKFERDWEVFATKCEEQNINVGKVFAPDNPGLYIRFLVTQFPKVFYIKNGVAHEVPNPNRNTLVTLIRDRKWNELKSVGFMSNPFSVQMSLLSHLFVHAVNLYSFEDRIVKQFVSFSSATDIAFGLTFIVVGTFLGLLLACAFDILQVIFMESKEPGDEDEKANKKTKEKSDKNSKDKSKKDAKEEVVKEPSEEESVRKRK